MTRYIGIDAHLETCSVVVLSASGHRLREVTVETSGAKLRRLVSEERRPRFVSLEEGHMSEWLFEILEPHCDGIVVVQPPRTIGSKSDRGDAWLRADELRRNAASAPVFKKPSAYRALREAVRAYGSIQRDLVRTKNQLKMLFASRGIRGTGNDLYDGNRRRPWLAKLPEARSRRAYLLADELDRLVDVYEAAQRWLEDEAKRIPEVSLVDSVPGLGLIRSAQLVAEVISPHRFRTRQQFWSYCGLGIVTHVSAEWAVNANGGFVRKKVPYTRGLTRRHNRVLKNVFKGAAKTVISHLDGHPWNSDFRVYVERGGKPHLGRLTIARKIAATALTVWKKQEPYDLTRTVHNDVAQS